MTVRELLKQLESQPLDAEVIYAKDTINCAIVQDAHFVWARATPQAHIEVVSSKYNQTIFSAVRLS